MKKDSMEKDLPHGDRGFYVAFYHHLLQYQVV
jgi:hypothetical protein